MTTILVVEDDDGIAALLHDFLTLDGYTVVCVADGIDALAVLDQVRPNLILSDVMMPRMDGWTLCRTLRADPRYAATPLVFITASSLDPPLGCQHVTLMRKPFDPRVLLETVDALLREQVRERA